VSTLDLDRARFRRAWTSLAETAAPRSDCPDPDRLWSACRGERSPEETRALVDHTAVCPTCAESWRLARELSAVAPAPLRDVPVAAGRSRRAWWGGLGGLAAATAAVVLAAVSLRGPGEVVYRDRPALTIRSLTREGRPVPRGLCVLRWTRGPAGTRYDVQVATEDLVAIARGRGLEVAWFQVPESALGALPAGSRLLWRVDATLPDGRRVASPTFVVTLR
jgi:hypothetical protein